MSAAVGVVPVCGGAESCSAPETGDAALVAQMAVGDGSALVALYERHGAALFGYAVRLAGDRGVAEEIVQDTLLGAWRSAGRFEGRARVRTWLFGIARRQARDRLRGRRWDLVELGEAVQVPEPGPGPEDVVLARADQKGVAAAVARVRPGHAEVLALVFVDGLSYAEVAEVLGVPVGTVRSRLHHAKRAVAAVLDNSRQEDSW